MGKRIETMDELVALGTQVKVIEVQTTPEILDFLDGHLADANRNESPTHTAKILSDMRSGRWAVNGETLKFNAAEELFDGQHRVKAAIEAMKDGVSVTFWLAFGCDENYVDWGRTRQAGDTLVIKHGIRNGKELAAAVAMVLRYENTQPGRRLATPSGAFLSKASIIDRALSDAGLRLACDAVGSSGWTNWMPRAAMTLSFYEGSKTSPELAMRFLSSMRSGAELDATDAAYVGREFLKSKKMRPGVHSVDPVWAAAITAQAWLAYEIGKTVKRPSLKYEATDPFPRFRCDPK